MRTFNLNTYVLGLFHISNTKREVIDFALKRVDIFMARPNIPTQPTAGTITDTFWTLLQGKSWYLNVRSIKFDR